MSEHDPKFCPYCGAKGVYTKELGKRCDTCRMVFFISYSRKLRKKAGDIK